MPYSREHKEETRARILESAARLFSRRGYDAISIDGLMQEAGLTRGAFYHHFANKDELYAEAILHATLKSPLLREKGASGPAAEWFTRTIGRYLSREHVDAEPTPCPLAFLVTDVGQRTGPVRSTYTRVFKNLIRLLRGQLRVRGLGQRDEKLMALSAMMIGAVAVARALDDKRAGDKLLDSCRRTAREMLQLES